MPTNKLWIEHTERAAWQSVQALREKLTEAEQRAERMAPPVEGWQKLFDALDTARESHALSGETYAELIRAALDRLARAEVERRSLEARPSSEPQRVPAEIRPLPARRPRRDEGSAWNTLSEIETRLADLPDLDPTEIAEIAADLAALARRLRPGSDLDDDD
jgi:hypothetical protein